MDSSVKYEKFAVAKDEDKEKHTGGRKKTLVVVLLVAILVVAISAVVAIGVGVGVSVGRESEPSGLKIITATENKIEGEYYNSAGGIYFLSIVNGSDTTLTIIASNGKIIVSARHPQNSSMVMMSMSEVFFLFLNDQPGGDFFDSQGFIIPENNVELMKTMMERNPNASEVLSMVDSTNATEVYQYSFELVIMGPEAELIIEAVQALGGGLNMKGSDYPSAMPFYLLALSLAEVRTSMDKAQNTEQVTRRQKERYGKETRSTTCQPLTFILGQLALDCPTCPNDRCTDTSECPIRNDISDCFGMCGPGCTCWPFICGDSDNDSCCRYEGCLSHDTCCSEAGFVTLQCGRVVVEFFSGNFNCDGEFRCSLF